MVAHFTPETTGWYAIDAQNKTNSKKAEGYIYNADGDSYPPYESTGDGFISYLESNTEYAIYLYVYNYSGEDITITITAVTAHSHIDENNDGVCDVEGCGYEFWTIFKENVPVRYVTEDYNNTAGYFTPAADGLYEFAATYNKNYNDVDVYPYDIEADEFLDYEQNGDGYAYRLEGGKKYEIEVYSDNGSGYPVTITLKPTHLHLDENDDGVCDVAGCGYEFWPTITENVPVRITTESDYTFIGCFTPASDGLYEVAADYDRNSNYVIAELYDPDSDREPAHEMNVNDYAYTLVGGKRYEVWAYSDNGSGYPVTLTARATHLHLDENDDGVCDVEGCGYEFWPTITENVPVTVTVENSDAFVGVFTPSADGGYEFITKYTSLNSDVGLYLRDKDGNYPEYGSAGSHMIYELQKGVQYGVFLYKYSFGSNEKVKVTLTAKAAHIHTDENNDGICDVEGCGYTLWVTLTEGVPADVNVFNSYSRVAYFTPEATGWYAVDAQNNTNLIPVQGYFRIADNNGYPDDEYTGGRYIYNLEAGTTYAVYLDVYSYSGEDITVTVTAASAHSHIDENNDGICDVEGCGYVLWLTLTQDVPATVTAFPNDRVIAYFTPESDGDFIFDSGNSNLSINVYNDVSGINVDYDYDYYGYNGFNNIYSLNGGVKYRVELYNYSYGPFSADTPVTATVTATRVHYTAGDETVIVEPTIAAYGAGSIVCDEHGETLYRMVYPEYNGYSSGATEDGFSYAIYSDGNGNMEAAITGYTGSETEVTIPSEINGVPVTSVGNPNNSGPFSSAGLFNMNPAIKSVVIPEGVKSIAPGAFTNLTGLEQVTIPDSVTVIGDEAFAGCVNLNTVIMGDGVKYIGEDAFLLIPDDAYKAYLEQEAAYMAMEAEYIEPYIESNKEQILNNQANEIKSLANYLGIEATSWQDINDYVDSLTDKEIEQIFGPGADKEDLKEYLEEKESYYNGQLAQIDSAADMFNNMPAVAEAVVNAQENPLERVMYAGSEDDWNAIITKDGNGQLAEAPRSYDGAGLFYATFMANGQVVAKVSFTSGQKSISEPPVPAKSGFTGKWEAYTLGNSDITINAVYSKIYTVTFNVDGKVVKKANVAAGAKIPTPPAPTKAGYTFKGWSPKVPAKMPAKNMTFKAVFEKNADAKLLFL